jgi:Cdc6-like AAA superfamily ATPase
MSNSKPQANFIGVQTKIYFQYLQNHIATNSMVSKALNIPQKNLCRYKRTLEDAGLLFEVYKGICKLTKFRATYLTTNKVLIPTKKI